MTNLKLIKNIQFKQKEKPFDEILKWLNDDIQKVNAKILKNMNSKVPLISQLS